MLAALQARAAATRERISTLTEPVAEALAPALVVVLGGWNAVFPYAVKAFHYGWIPLVLLLGMRAHPQPKLIDLLTPM